MINRHERLPSNQTQRAKWIQTIKKHQEIDGNRQKFRVCIRHFCDEVLKPKGNKKTLIDGAVPSIFKNRSDTPPDSTINANNQTESILRAEMADFRKQMLLISTENDIKSQKLQQTIFSLEKNKNMLLDKLKEIQKELAQERSKNGKLEKEICALKGEKNVLNISLDSNKFPNVSLRIYSSEPTT